ncbi:cobalamin biosynthesis protein, putative [Babesia ovata]|uniref:Cobalamin biosynthesis protein, putative n=1 Tax=Babesia ovata TaxID=189622 RepID=A0A2H6KIT8_9APIC|nr:cobalamin biosynthesis protein, putative [Babesia ovata]GBE62897.1 cobalamin biosynthesis protein, putative [Babesia ovata]
MLDHCITLAPEQDVAMRLNALIEHGVRKPCEPRENVPDSTGVPRLRRNTQVTETQVTLEVFVEFVERLHDIIGELSNLLAAAVTVVPELAVRNARRGDPVAALLEEHAEAAADVNVVMCPPICAAHSELIDGAEQRVGDGQQNEGAFGGLRGVRLFRRVD